MSEFDSKARDWDKNKMHTERSEAIARAIIKMIPLNNKMKALEFGAGTGLLSFILKDRLNEITLMDNSSEMVRVAQEKITSEKTSNMNVICLDLEKDDYSERFDLIFNQMVLHHVTDIENIFIKFFSMLNSGGFLAIADLYTEDGEFHGNSFSGHRGFDTEVLEKMLTKIGYKNISHQQCYSLAREIEHIGVKEFPVFLLTATK